MNKKKKRSVVDMFRDREPDLLNIEAIKWRLDHDPNDLEQLGALVFLEVEHPEPAFDGLAIAYAKGQPRGRMGGSDSRAWLERQNEIERLAVDITRCVQRHQFAPAVAKARELRKLLRGKPRKAGAK